MSTCTIGGVIMLSQIRVPCPAWFRRYLLDGDHWRAGKRVQGELARFAGLALHGGNDQEQGSTLAFNERFAEFLHQSLLDDRVARTIKNTSVNHGRVEKAIKDIREVLPDEMAALLFYVVPKRRRGQSVVQKADELRLSTDALRDAAERGVVEVWEELGGVWFGTEAV